MKHLQRPEFLLLLLALALAIFAGGQPLLDARPGGGILDALTGQMEAARQTRLLVGVLVLGALAIVLLRTRALTLPKLDAQSAFAGILIFLALPVGFSPFPWVSADNWLHWAVYAAVFLLTGMAVGRRQGPAIVIGVIVGVGAIMALKGIREYDSMRAVEPGYRIFAGWSNPNAVASLFIACLPPALAAAASEQRQLRLTGLISTPLLATALLFTQSKGGLAAGAVGVFVFLILLAVWKAPKASWGGALLSLALGGALFFGIQAVPKTQGAAGPAPLARLSSSGGEAEQSAGFRTLLWKTSWELAKERPLGWGSGVFRFVGGRPGLVTQTASSHNTYLQVLVDGGFLALLSLLVLAFAWLRKVFAQASSLLPEQNVLRAGALAGVLGAGAHGLVESNLTFLGLGVVFFALMSLSLQLSADGTAPEAVPQGLRRMAALLACGAPLCLLGISASLEREKGEMLASAAQGQRPAASSPAFAFLDGEASYVSAITGASGASPLRDLESAADLHPSTRVLRALARAQAAEGSPTAAITTLTKALMFDPNNLPALWLKVQVIEESGNKQEALDTARELVAKEQTPTFRVRSLAELVPTETYRARFWIAERTSDAAEKEGMVREGVKGMASFARLTVPVVVRFTSAGLDYGGVTKDEAIQWLEEALKAARSMKDTQGLSDDLDAIATALSSLRTLN